MPGLFVLCESRTELCKLLKDNRPARKRGGDRKSEEIKAREPKFEKTPTPGTRQYIEERLKRDHPKVWKDYYFGLYYALLRTCACGRCRFGGMSSDGLADAVTKKRLRT